jgi:photosystem II stability/assembly factor-like uncharacterized protein
MTLRAARVAACAALIMVVLLAHARAQERAGDSAIPREMYSALKWRLIGPHRGGRVLAVSGVRGQPETFYFGSVAGGVWKTFDAGRTWTPIFDEQPIASIGALAVAPSNPNVIYVGTGEADMRSDITFGGGVYKSTDAGKTWAHVGLTDTQQIGRVLVDPRDPSIVLVAALGHGFGPNAERGVFRTTDGGKTWQKVLYRDENTGAIDLAYDPEDARTVYASMWNARRVAWSAYAPVTGPGGGIYKSTDGGATWKELKGHGLPEGQIGRVGLDVAAGQGGRRVYALIDAQPAGLYRSDDAGESWRLVGTDARITSRAWYFSGVNVDPKNADVVYVSNVSIYRSTDGGQTFQAFKGAPGGDDYHALWIDPEDTERMISGSDQGTVVSVNGGRTWSSWYNQPTAQFYHVAVDNQFPYFVYGAQQDSGTAAVSSRSDYGQITFRDWYSVGTGESGYIVPDPDEPGVAYGGSTGGDLYRYTRRTGQVEDISPTPDEFGPATNRYPWTTALAITRSRVIYQASQFLFRSNDNGKSWTTISPDLTLQREGGAKAEHDGGAKADEGKKIDEEKKIGEGKKIGEEKKVDEGKAVIYTVAPSPVSEGQIWVGTDNGVIQLTRDAGKSWENVTPKNLHGDWSMVSTIDASTTDAATAYAAIDRHQRDDLNPHAFRTHDFGKTWTPITDGIHAPAYVRVVRADPLRAGLLFAGTELGVYVSFDDGDHWQPLQLNLPVTSVRDLVIKGDDLVVATHGRSFWILDDITPLRQLSAEVLKAGAYLFRPAAAIRVRKSVNRDTPLPPDTPAGQNPPTGAVIDYTLKSAPEGEVTLEILDSAGQLVRKFSSADEPRKIEDVQSFPTYWLRPSAPLSKSAGLNRFVWDLRYAQPSALRYEHSIAASFGEDTPTEPEGPLALPGTYQVRLTVAGRSLTAPLEVKLDPRVTVAQEALSRQLALELKIRDALAESYDAALRVRDLRRQLGELRTRAVVATNDKESTKDKPANGKEPANDKELADAISALERKAAALSGVQPSGVPPQSPDAMPTLDRLNASLAALMTTVGSADAVPTAQASAAFNDYRQLLTRQLEAWAVLKDKDLVALNVLLRRRKLPAINVH